MEKEDSRDSKGSNKEANANNNEEEQKSSSTNEEENNIAKNMKN